MGVGDGADYAAKPVELGSLCHYVVAKERHGNAWRDISEHVGRNVRRRSVVGQVFYLKL